jgi:hypothetical protein
MYGCVILYHACNLLFTLFTAACAMSLNLSTLIGFCFVAGSAPLTLGGGTIVDMVA